MTGIHFRQVIVMNSGCSRARLVCMRIRYALLVKNTNKGVKAYRAKTLQPRLCAYVLRG